MTINKCMIDSVITITPEKTAAEALELMLAHNISGVPVVDHEQNLLGVISKSDIFSNIMESQIGLTDTRVEDIMNTKVCFARPADSLKNAVERMIKYDINRLPIVRDGKVIGIITRDDVISYYVKSSNPEQETR